MSAYGELRAHGGELKAMKNAMIRYILNVAPKKTPFKSIDIVKQCLRGEKKWFIQLLPEVQEALNDVSLISIQFKLIILLDTKMDHNVLKMYSFRHMV